MLYAIILVIGYLTFQIMVRVMFSYFTNVVSIICLSHEQVFNISNKLSLFCVVCIVPYRLKISLRLQILDPNLSYFSFF